MKNLKKIFLGAAAIIGIATLASCSDSDKMFGTWETSNPAVVSPTFEGTVSTTEVTTIEFIKGTDKKSGPVKFTSRYELTLPADSTGLTHNSTITATIDGTWTREDKSDDDFFLSFDTNSMNVNAISAPELGPATERFLQNIAKFSQIDDVEVSKDNEMMTFENTADQKYVFKRVKFEGK